MMSVAFRAYAAQCWRGDSKMHRGVSSLVSGLFVRDFHVARSVVGAIFRTLLSCKTAAATVPCAEIRFGSLSFFFSSHSFRASS